MFSFRKEQPSQENVNEAEQVSEDLNSENQAEKDSTEPSWHESLYDKLTANKIYKFLGSFTGTKFVVDVVGNLAYEKGDIHEMKKAKKGEKEITGDVVDMIDYLRSAAGIADVAEIQAETKDFDLEMSRKEASSQLGLEEKYQLAVDQINESNISDAEKDELLEKITDIIFSGSEQQEQLDKNYTKNVSQVVESYIQSKAKAVGVAKDAMNTTLTATGFFALKGALYGLAAITQRALKASSSYTKGLEGGEESKKSDKLKHIAIDSCMAVVETGRAFFFQGAKNGSQHKVVEFFQAVGNILLFLGIGGSAVNQILKDGVVGSLTASINTFRENIEDDGVVSGVAETIVDNFVNNSTRTYTMIKNFFSGDSIPDSAPETENLTAPSTNGSETIETLTAPGEPPVEHSLLYTEATEKGFQIDNVDGKLVATMEIGKDGAYDHLDQALRRIVVDGMAMERITDSDGFSILDAAKAENVIGNLRTLMNSGMPHFKNIIEFKGDQLIVHDFDKLNSFFKDAWGHADDIVTDKSDAVAYANETARTVWQDMIDKKISTIQALADSGVKVGDLATSEQIQFNHYAEQIKGLYSEETSVNIDLENHSVNLNGTDIIIERGKIVQIGEQQFQDGIVIDENLSTNIIKQQLAEYGLTRDIDQYAAVVNKIGLTDQAGDYLLSPQEFEQLKHLDQLTDGFIADKLIIFEKNYGLVQFASNHRDVNLENLKIFGERFSDTALRDGLFKNNEAVELVIKHANDTTLNETKVAHLFGTQRQIADNLNLSIMSRVSLDQIYELQGEGIQIEADEVNSMPGIRLDIPSSANHDGGTLFASKDGKVSLMASANEFLGKGQHTHTFKTVDQIFSSEQNLRILHQQLLTKEMSQNLLYTELEEAAGEKGLFKWMAIVMDRRYLSAGMELPATNLASEEAFKEALLDYGQSNNLPIKGQVNNFERLYDVIRNKTAGDKKGFANFFKINPPHETETIRQYLGRVVGEDISPDQPEPVNALDEVAPSVEPTEVQQASTIQQVEPSIVNYENLNASLVSKLPDNVNEVAKVLADQHRFVEFEGIKGPSGEHIVLKQDDGILQLNMNEYIDEHHFRVARSLNLNDQTYAVVKKGLTQEKVDQLFKNAKIIDEKGISEPPNLVAEEVGSMDEVAPSLEPELEEEIKSINEIIATPEPVVEEVDQAQPDEMETFKDVETTPEPVPEVKTIEEVQSEPIVEDIKEVDPSSSTSSEATADKDVESINETVATPEIVVEPNYEELLTKYDFKPYAAEDPFYGAYARKIFDSVKLENINDGAIDITSKARGIMTYAEQMSHQGEQEVIDKQ
ncbi:MAG: hypothetical protein ABH884_01140, partial [Candidatus Komeilibacteria bacterium]